MAVVTLKTQLKLWTTGRAGRGLYMADQHTSFRIKERYFAVKVSEIAKNPFGLFTFKISQ